MNIRIPLVSFPEKKILSKKSQDFKFSGIRKQLHGGLKLFLQVELSLHNGPAPFTGVSYGVSRTNGRTRLFEYSGRAKIPKEGYRLQIVPNCCKNYRALSPARILCVYLLRLPNLEILSPSYKDVMGESLKGDFVLVSTVY